MHPILLQSIGLLQLFEVLARFPDRPDFKAIDDKLGLGLGGASQFSLDDLIVLVTRLAWLSCSEV